MSPRLIQCVVCKHMFESPYPSCVKLEPPAGHQSVAINCSKCHFKILL